MKKINLFFCALAASVALYSCGGSDNRSNEDSAYESTQSFSDVAGKWALRWNDDGVLNVMDVKINYDGTGRIKLWYSVGMQPSKTVIDENVTYTRDGNDIYVNFSTGAQGHFVVKGRELYSDDGQSLSRN